MVLQARVRHIDVDYGTEQEAMQTYMREGAERAVLPREPAEERPTDPPELREPPDERPAELPDERPPPPRRWE